MKAHICPNVKHIWILFVKNCLFLWHFNNTKLTTGANMSLHLHPLKSSTNSPLAYQITLNNKLGCFLEIKFKRLLYKQPTCRLVEWRSYLASQWLLFYQIAPCLCYVSTREFFTSNRSFRIDLMFDLNASDLGDWICETVGTEEGAEPEVPWTISGSTNYIDKTQKVSNYHINFQSILYHTNDMPFGAYALCGRPP